MNRIEELTLKHLDGGLDPAEARELDALVAGDAEAARIHADLLKLDAGLRAELLEVDVSGPAMKALYAELAGDTMKQVSSVAARKGAAVPGARGNRPLAFRKILRYAAAPLAAAILLSLGLHLWQTRQALTGIVMAAQGGATADGVAVLVGDALSPSHQVQTAVGGRVISRYRDGSVVELGSDTAAGLAGGWWRGGKRLDLSRGKLTCAIAPQAAPMVLSTPHATATVLGTRFEMDVTPAETTLQVAEGAVRLEVPGKGAGTVVKAGSRAVASLSAGVVLTDATTSAATAGAPGTCLFNGQDLAGWKITKGSWQVADGVMVGHNPKGGSCRIETLKPYRRFELECQVRVDANAWAEFQIEDYAHFFAIENAVPTVWHELKVTVSGNAFRATLDGEALPLKRGESERSTGAGSLAFYVTAGKSLWVKDVYVRELE